jgi:Fe-S cluster assembly iron-binding protein IscA
MNKKRNDILLSLGDEYIEYLNTFINGIDKKYIYYDEHHIVKKFIKNKILIDNGKYYTLNKSNINYIKNKVNSKFTK